MCELDQERLGTNCRRLVAIISKTCNRRCVYNPKTVSPHEQVPLFALAHRLAKRLDLETKTLALLKAADDLEQVPGLGISVRSEHAHQALGRFVCQPG